MILFDEAVQRLRAAAVPLGSEPLAIDAAHGRTLAAPVIAAIDAPRHAVSVMDGYAVGAADAAAGTATLRLVGESWPGQPPGADLAPGETRRVLTGSAVPRNTARVVAQEQAVVDDPALEPAPIERAAVTLTIGAGDDAFVRGVASDFACGATLIASGSVLTAGALIAAAGADAAMLRVWRQPRVVIIATGDELVAPGSARAAPGTVPDSASVGVAAITARWGGVVVRRLRIGDDLAMLSAAADAALRDADVVVTIGGASVGPRDFARRMFEQHGPEALFEKVAMRPGRPVWVARANAPSAPEEPDAPHAPDAPDALPLRWIVGLPGNPGSALVTARLLLAPLLSALGGRPFDAALDWQAMTLGTAVGATAARAVFERAVLHNGALMALDNQASGAQSPLGQATHLIRRPARAPACAAGDSVAAISLY